MALRKSLVIGANGSLEELPAGDTLEGASGGGGTTWRNGNSVPANTLGVNGDYFVDDITKKVYRKDVGVYNEIGSISATEAFELALIF